MKAFLPCVGLSIALCGAIALPSHADEYGEVGGSPVRVTISQPSTAVTDVLAAISHQSGALVEADSSVQDVMNPCEIDGSNVEDALNALDKQVPSLSWTKVFVPSNANPNPDDLSAAVKALRKLGLSDMAIEETAGGTTVLHKESGRQQALDRRVIYLVTNDQAWLRVQAVKDYQAAVQATPSPPPSTDDLVNSTMANLHAIAQSFPRMSADQQAQIMPLVWQQLREITKNLSPEVLNRFEHTVPTPE